VKPSVSTDDQALKALPSQLDFSEALLISMLISTSSFLSNEPQE
jgi:hypothetical protein